MPTRRSALLLLGNALVGSGAVASGAFENASAEVEGDLQVLADRRGPPFRLKPGRPDEAYVETDADGFVEAVVLNGAGVPGEGLNRTAVTRFERLVLLCNRPPGPPIDELYFEFEVSDEGLGSADPSPADIESVLFIASAGGDVPGDGSRDFLEATDHGQTGADKITPNEELSFGIGVDLGPESALQKLPAPEKFAVTLTITAKPTADGSGEDGDDAEGDSADDGGEQVQDDGDEEDSDSDGDDDSDSDSDDGDDDDGDGNDGDDDDEEDSDGKEGDEDDDSDSDGSDDDGDDSSDD